MTRFLDSLCLCEKNALLRFTKTRLERPQDLVTRLWRQRDRRSWIKKERRIAEKRKQYSAKKGVRRAEKLGAGLHTQCNNCSEYLPETRNNCTADCIALYIGSNGFGGLTLFTPACGDMQAHIAHLRSHGPNRKSTLIVHRELDKVFSGNPDCSRPCVCCVEYVENIVAVWSWRTVIGLKMRLEGGRRRGQQRRPGYCRLLLFSSYPTVPISHPLRSSLSPANSV